MSGMKEQIDKEILAAWLWARSHPVLAAFIACVLLAYLAGAFL